MAQVIKNLGQFAKVLEPKVVATLELVAEDVKKEIDKALEDYYDEYDPMPYDDDAILMKTYWYYRTEQLLNCCRIGTPKISGNTISIEIYLDIKSLNYTTPGASPLKTVVAANAGLHGGWDVGEMVQIPWENISDNNGKSWGTGTQIWEEPMEKLFTKSKLVESFKRHAKQRGLNLK